MKIRVIRVIRVLFFMRYFWQAVLVAFKLIISLDSEVIKITLTSLEISTIAIMLAALVGVPIGFIIGITGFRGRSVIITLLNTLMALPTVVIGLFGYAFFSRQGLLEVLALPA